MKPSEEQTVKVALPRIEHDRSGFCHLTDFYAALRACDSELIEVDMSSCGWFDADMCSPLGAILYKLSRKLNEVRLTNIRPDVKKILCRNGFLLNYGEERLPDSYGTTIRYKRFDSKDDKDFTNYVERRLLGRAEIPRMSQGLARKFRESVFEIFSNAVIHSQTQYGIFCCGQYFPKRHRIVLCISDLGIGIKTNIRKTLDLDLPDDKAIEWATTDRNTTKRGTIPGGLGLKLLKEFIAMNKGSIQIVSEKGYWGFLEGHVRQAVFNHRFPGTVVTIDINTADTSSYKLSSEISEEDIF